MIAGKSAAKESNAKGGQSAAGTTVGVGPGVDPANAVAVAVGAAVSVAAAIEVPLGLTVGPWAGHLGETIRTRDGKMDQVVGQGVAGIVRARSGPRGDTSLHGATAEDGAPGSKPLLKLE